MALTVTTSTPPSSKLRTLLTSRKFWAAVTAVSTALGMYVDHALTGGQFIQAFVAALGLYILGTAHEDNGRAQATEIVVGPAPAAGTPGAATGTRTTITTEPPPAAGAL